MENMKISAAFVKAQREFAPALKTATNPHFRSKYVALDGCIEAVIDALNSNGIALMQKSHESDNGVTIETLFIHESGESLSGGLFHVPAVKHDAQGYGSALTYARRYSLMSAAGIAPEDDDGNAAVKAKAPVIPASPKTADLGLSNDELSHITDMSEAIKELTPSEALDLILAAKLEENQTIALWNMLPSNIRTVIKKEKESRKQTKG